MVDGPREYNMCFMNMKNIRYTEEAIEIMQYLIDRYYVPEEVDANGSRMLHILCSIGEQDYVKDREFETGKHNASDDFRNEYALLCKELMVKLEQKEPCADFENKRGETPVTLCL